MLRIIPILYVWYQFITFVIVIDHCFLSGPCKIATSWYISLYWTRLIYIQLNVIPQYFLNSEKNLIDLVRPVKYKSHSSAFRKAQYRFLILLLWPSLTKFHFRSTLFNKGLAFYYVSKVFRKTNNFYPLICLRIGTYQRVKTSYSESFTYAPNKWSLTGNFSSKFKTILILHLGFLNCLLG